MMFDDEQIILDVSPNSCFCTKSGEVLFFQNAEEFRKYLADNLGEDFARCLKPDSETYSDSQELLEDIEATISEYSKVKSPICVFKKHKELIKLLQRCADVLDTV